MDRPEKDQKSAGELSRLLLSWPGLAIVASAAALLFEGVRFQLARPASDGGVVTESAADLRVESRSWKDPFQAVLPHTPSPKDTNVARYVRGASDALQSITDKINASGPMAVMAVLVSSSPYPNGIESRIRSRVAIQSAMRAGGFVSEDSDHLRYLIHVRTTNAAQAAAVEASPADWTYVPFEWFATDPTVPKSSQFERVLLLWLRESDFIPAPFARIHTLLSQVFPQNGAAPLSNVNLAILGPRTSGGLEAMIKDETFAGSKSGSTSNATPRALDMLLGAQIISATATAPDAYFVPNLGDDGSHLLRRSRVTTKIESNLPGSRFVHYGATDADLCFLLVAELAMRGVNVQQDNIVLLSEYDTFYGRQLPLTFKAAVLSLKDSGEFKNHSRYPKDLVTTIRFQDDGAGLEWTSKYCQLMYRFETNLVALRKKGTQPTLTNIRQYSYLAGVDGDRSLRDTPKGSKKDGTRSPDEEDAVDRPEGEHQLDYMGRLALELRGREAGLLQGHDQIRDVKAVGVLGGDFYDKLLMLQALRSSAPQGVFFTTDLDARLNLRSQRAWTRNVITASGFGLSPRNNRADSVIRLAPMRDGYQVATFTGCISFLESKSSPTEDPGVYEIGRVLPHRLTLPSVKGGADNASSYWDGWRSSVQRTPQYLSQAPTLAAGVYCYLLVLAAITLLGTKRWWYRVGTALLGLVGLFVIVVLGMRLFEDSLEPLELGDGVSSLASVGVLVVTLVVIGYTIWRYCSDPRDPTNSPGFIVAVGGIIALTIYVLWPVNPPFRGPGCHAMRFLMMLAWCASGVTVMITGYFWRSFALEARDLMRQLESTAKTVTGANDWKPLISSATDLAQRTEQYGTLHFLPMAVLFLLLLASSAWIDSWHWTPWMVGLVIFKLAILIVFPIALHRLASRCRDRLHLALDKFEDGDTPDPDAPRIRKIVDRLNHGCFAPLARQPIFAALGTALGTSGVISLIQPLLSK